MTQRNGVFRIATGDPNGNVMAESPAICYTDDGAIWTKSNDGFNFDGWNSIVASPAPTAL